MINGLQSDFLCALAWVAPKGRNGVGAPSTEIDRQAVGSVCQSEVLRRYAGDKDANGDPVARAGCGRIRQRKVLGSQATGQAKAIGIASEGEVAQGDGEGRV